MSCMYPAPFYVNLSFWYCWYDILYMLWRFYRGSLLKFKTQIWQALKQSVWLANLKHSTKNVIFRFTCICTYFHLHHILNRWKVRTTLFAKQMSTFLDCFHNFQTHKGPDCRKMNEFFHCHWLWRYCWLILQTCEYCTFRVRDWKKKTLIFLHIVKLDSRALDNLVTHLQTDGH